MSSHECKMNCFVLIYENFAILNGLLRFIWILLKLLTKPVELELIYFYSLEFQLWNASALGHDDKEIIMVYCHAARLW